MAQPRLVKRALMAVAAVALWHAADAALPADESAYDLVIRNGRIIDGTGNPWFHGDVAVRGDRIVALGRVPDAAASTCRPTSIPRLAATMIWRASFRPGRMKAGKTPCWPA